MNRDIEEPLAQYRDSLQAEHARNTAVFFENLVRRSGVDEKANATLMQELQQERQAQALCRKQQGFWTLIMALGYGLLVVGVIVSWWVIAAQTWHAFIFVPLCVIAAGLVIWQLASRIHPRLAELRQQLQLHEEVCRQKEQEGWRQLEPLNRLYDWGMVSRLVNTTLPQLVLDPFVSQERLTEMQAHFGLNPFNQNQSVLFAQSGSLNGNPFAIVNILEFGMTEKTYRGSRNISWREKKYYVDSKGRRRAMWVTRHQTLVAHVTKPAPGYFRDKMLVYANEAAPNLCFTRRPSKLSQSEDNLITRWGKKAQLKKLESLSRNLTDSSGYTLMGNREFEVLFQTTDRNNEIEFRLLFTPLAQQQMVALLKDRQVGYGDNFAMIKRWMINLIRPAHLNSFDDNNDPGKFYHYDLSQARVTFYQYHQTYFKVLYFAFAPLLTIPLYQQHRSTPDIYRDVYGAQASAWEHEALANYYDSRLFRHPSSETDNILKTEVRNVKGDSQEVSVTASGFRSEPRVDYVPMLGGDGKMHQVPVRWRLYIPVRKTTSMIVKNMAAVTSETQEQDNYFQELKQFCRQWKAKEADILSRRSLASFVRKK